MKEEAIKIIRARTGDESYSASDIQWVLTVPAIWTPAAKQFMREAAYKVGKKKILNNLDIFILLLTVPFTFAKKDGEMLRTQKLNAGHYSKANPKREQKYPSHPKFKIKEERERSDSEVG